jgi:plasmid maintenance system antidote protein VapI
MALFEDIIFRLDNAMQPSEMAIRLAKAFGGNADIWVRMQASSDLSKTMERENEIDVSPLRYANV